MACQEQDAEMTVERKARWDDEWPAWSGDKERLGRLAYTMDGLIEQRREQDSDFNLVRLA